MGLLSRPFRGPASAGAGGAFSGGRVALPDRATAPAAPTPPPLGVPGGAYGGVLAAEATDAGVFYTTLPFGQAPLIDMSASPEKLKYSRFFYENVAGVDHYQAPTQVSWTENAAIGPAGHGAVSPIPHSRKRYDTRTWYRQFLADAQRYPNGGEGTPRVVGKLQIGRARRTVRAQAQMTTPVQDQLTQLPAASSFGSTTQQVLAPFQEGSVFA